MFWTEPVLIRHLACWWRGGFTILGKFEAAHGDMGKAPDQMISTLCRQFPFRGGPPFKAVETVGNDHPACLGVRQDLAWERLGNGEVEMVGPPRYSVHFGRL